MLDHYFDTIVRGRYDGTYDKFNRAGELIMSNYFSVRDGKIVSLAVIVSQPVRIRRNRGMTRRPLRGRPRPRSPATPGIGRASPPPAFLRPARRMTRFGAVITKLLRTYTIRILRQDKRLRDQRADVWRPSSGIYRYAGPMGWRVPGYPQSAVRGGCYGLVVSITVRHHSMLMRDGRRRALPAGRGHRRGRPTIAPGSRSRRSGVDADRSDCSAWSTGRRRACTPTSIRDRIATERQQAAASARKPPPAGWWAILGSNQ